MKSRPHQLGAALLGCFGALHAVGMPVALAADGDANRQSVSELAAARGRESLNLARADLGTRLELVAGTGTADKSAPTALLHDDDPLGCRLPAGVTSMIMSLPKTEVLNRFNFINLTAGGKVTISVADTKLAADSPLWRTVDSGKEFSPDGSEVVASDLRGAEGRYVKLDFDVRTAGSIDTFGLFGRPTLASSPGVAVSVAKEKGASGADAAMLYNYAVSNDHAGVVMISQGEDLQEAQKMADGDVSTSFAFRANDPRPLAVVDLGETRSVKRVSLTFRAGPGHLDVYLLPDPEKRGGAGRTIQETVAGDFTAGLQPVLSQETGGQTGLNRVGGDANDQVGRYLVMVYKPAGVSTAAIESKDFKDSGDFKDMAGPAPAGQYGQPLVVSEVTVTGFASPGTYTYTNGNPNIPNVPGSGGRVPSPVLPPPSGGNVITP